MLSKLAPAKGQKGRKYEGFKSLMVKKEEMTAAMTERNPPPKRKRDPSTEVIILSDNSENKMEIDKEIEMDEEVLSVNLSEEDLVLK